MKKTILLVMLALFYAASLSAQSAPPVNIPYLRAVAMGNAFNAMPDEHMTILYNPAMIATNEKFKFKVSPFVAGYDPESSQMLSSAVDIWNLLSGQTAWTGISPDLQDKLNNNLSLGLKASLLGLTVIIPSKKIGNIGFGLYNAADVYGMMSPGTGIPPYPTVSAQVLFDFVFTAAWSHNINQYIKKFPGTLYAGVSLTKIARAQLLMPATQVDAISTALGAGSGLGFNIGALYMLPKRDNLKFSVAFNDITSTVLTMSDGSVSKIYPRTNLGVSYKPKKISFSKDSAFDFGDRLTLCADVNSFLGGDISKNIHLGFEYSWALLSLRMGFNQGLMTYGFKFLGFLEYASYQEDISGAKRQLIYWSVEF